MIVQLYVTAENGAGLLLQRLYFRCLEAPRTPSRRWSELHSNAAILIVVGGRPSDGLLRTRIAGQRQASIAWRIGSWSAYQFLSPGKARDRLEQADKWSLGDVI